MDGCKRMQFMKLVKRFVLTFQKQKRHQMNAFNLLIEIMRMRFV